MNTREFWANEAAKVRDTSALFSNNDAVLGREVLDIADSQSTPLKNCDIWREKEIGIREVYPFKIDGLIKETDAYWLFAGTKLRLAEKTIIGEKISEQQRGLVDRLLYGEPWQYATSRLRDTGFNWKTYSLDYREHGVKEGEHTQLLAQIKASNLTDFKKEMNDFKTKLRIFVDSFKKYQEENDDAIGYNRFNSYYTDETTKKILNAITEVKFIPAEVKALQMQETGDFTDTMIAGIDKKNKGIVYKGKENFEMVGICQLPIGSSNEAQKWVENTFTTVNGIKTLTIGGNRKDPLNAIHLTAGYFGQIIKILQADWDTEIIKILNAKYKTNIQITGHSTNSLDKISCSIDKKKAIFLSYNAGPSMVKSAIESYCVKGTEMIIWDDPGFQKILKEKIDLFYATADARKEKSSYVNSVAARLIKIKTDS